MSQISKIDELLESENFRKRTAMYIDEKKISNLSAFLNGVFYYLDTYQVESGSSFGDFHDWVAKYYGWRESTAGWKNILLKECRGDEERAVDEFFKLYDKFKLEHKEI